MFVEQYTESQEELKTMTEETFLQKLPLSLRKEYNNSGKCLMPVTVQLIESCWELANSLFPHDFIAAVAEKLQFMSYSLNEALVSENILIKEKNLFLQIQNRVSFKVLFVIRCAERGRS